ncbi:hypothetical protein B0A50_06771 [Salinomyces thailandicus]|uniref:DNA polymerase eta n=1 Tax=Salinomyces thailandicus TaxID=706561 RepID=A0A4U0TQC0_9PEZI|nr:hypothetical protein B0A50_06771 [Salinomyces thailandica]
MTSSSPPFPASSQLSSNASRRKSKYTWKHLSTLAAASPHCPLRVIAHLDLDAFYAQCETVRLGEDPAKPLAVQQWQGLIAINYPARAYGLNRHVTITEAKEKCPDLICQHVATWKEGDTKWSYSDDAFKEIATRKVSLDPYRIQSRRILAVIKDCLPKDLQRVEKASIDEVFLDLSAHVHHLLLARYPELRGPPPYDDPTEPLPRPPITALDWAADTLIDLPAPHSEEDDPDWDDIALHLASEIIRDVRARIFTELHFTSSAGLARNKPIAKLGSAHHKPAHQTLIRNRAISHFLSTMKFTKIRHLGGKLGDEVIAAFNTEHISDLLLVPLPQLQKTLGDDTGAWLHATIRGEDHSEVNPRTQIQSMLSAKSFRPSINSFLVAGKWLRIFAADIFSRLVEEGVLENRRRPKTVNLHHRQGASTRSRQAPIPLGRQVTEEGLFDLARQLLAQVVGDGRAWPCANLSLSVGGFEDGVVGNRGIGGFLVHGEEAKALKEGVGRRSEGREEGEGREPAEKKRKVGEEGIGRFFGAKGWRGGDGGRGGDVADHVEVNEYEEAEEEEEDEHEGHEGDEDPAPEDLQNSTAALTNPPSSPIDKIYSPPSTHPPSQPNPHQPSNHDHSNHDPKHAPGYLPCPDCSILVASAEQAEHADFHFALALQAELGGNGGGSGSGSAPVDSAQQQRPASAKAGGHGEDGVSGKGRGRGRGRGRGGGSRGEGRERGQRKLAFG